jgi:hypothetical protein
VPVRNVVPAANEREQWRPGRRVADSCVVEWSGARVGLRCGAVDGTGEARLARQSGRIRGSPKEASMLVSNRVIAQIRSPAKVSTSSPAPCRIRARGSRT